MDRKFQGGRGFSSERSDRSDRFGRFDRFDRDSDRQERGFSDRARGGFSSDRRDERRSDRRDDRRGFGQRKGSFDDKRRSGFSKPDFGVRSGPRARALETRRFSERSDFAKNALVKLDADIAQYFEGPEAVNKALRMIVEAGLMITRPGQKAAAVGDADKSRIFVESSDEDDDEASYGEALKAQEAEKGEE